MWIGWTCSPFLTSSDQHNAETLVLWVAKLKLSNNSLYCLTGCDDLSLNVSLSATRVRTQGCHQALRLLLKFENTFHHQGPTLKSHSRNPSAVDLLTTMTGRPRPRLCTSTRSYRSRSRSSPPRNCPLAGGTSALPNCDSNVARNLLATLHNSWNSVHSNPRRPLRQIPP